jgi:hypothetical protein
MMELISVILQCILEFAIHMASQVDPPYVHIKRILLPLGFGIISFLLLFGIELAFPSQRTVSEMAGGFACISSMLALMSYFILLVKLWINRRKELGKFLSFKADCAANRIDT